MGSLVYWQTRVCRFLEQWHWSSTWSPGRCSQSTWIYLPAHLSCFPSHPLSCCPCTNILQRWPRNMGRWCTSRSAKSHASWHHRPPWPWSSWSIKMSIFAPAQLFVLVRFACSKVRESFFKLWQLLNFNVHLYLFSGWEWYRKCIVTFQLMGSTATDNVL